MKAKAESVREMRVLTEEEVRHVTGGSNGNFPPGQFPSGNPAHAPGNSNPNENGGPK
jgi:hypothetical protein